MKQHWFVYIALSVSFCLFCQKRLIKKDDLSLVNEYYSDKTYYLKDNLEVGKELFKKNTSVKIYIESTPTLLKIKIYPSNIEREAAVGKMVTYLVNEDFKGKSFTVEYLDKMIEEKLVAYNPDQLRLKKTKK
jgi:type II secretion system-associated lipoprotein